MVTYVHESGGSESLRKVVHISMVGFAFLLRFLTPWQAFLAAAAALTHNLWILPRFWGRKIYRDQEVRRGLPVGIIVYPLSVLLLILLYGHWMFIVAGAWAMMALGDGLAGILGLNFGRTKLPWNRRKSLEGIIGFILGGTAGAASLIYWTTRGRIPEPWRTESWIFFILIPAGVAVVVSLVETLPLKLDDNLTVPMSAGFLLFMSYHVGWLLDEPPQWQLSWWLLSAAINLFPALMFFLLGWVNGSGFLTGVVVGWITLGAGNLSAYVILFVFFFLGSMATFMGRESKKARGIAESGRRSSANVLAKCGSPTLCILWYALTPAKLQHAVLVTFITGYTAALMDTASSEIGKWLGRRTFLWWRWQRVPPGTEGAISLEGTLAGFIAGGFLTALAAMLWPHWISLPIIGIILASAWAANLLESFLGSFLQPRELASNEEINAILVVAAMTLAFIAFRIFYTSP